MAARLLLLVLFMMAAPVRANDTLAELGAGGLVFVTSPAIEMESEDLFVSPEKVEVTYRFINRGESDESALVAFPMPEVTGSEDVMVNLPGDDPANLFGFSTTVSGAPVAAGLHQYAFALGIDRSALLARLNIPLAPFGAATEKALAALKPEDQQQLVDLGLVRRWTYDAGQGETTTLFPVWTLRSAYSWQALFPAGKTVTIVHRYRPSVGGTVATTFLAPPDLTGGEDRPRLYREKYCTDERFIRTVRKSLRDPADPYSAPYLENWIDYIWSTGANWNGPIRNFHLTIDKGDARNLVSFCWDGDVTKTGPTRFEMRAVDWYPPPGRELNILILNPQP